MATGIERERLLGPKTLNRKRRRVFIIGALIAGTLTSLFLLWYFIVIGSGIFRIDQLVIVAHNDQLKNEVTTFLHTYIPGNGIFSRIAGFFNMTAWPSELSGDELVFLPSVVRLDIQKNIREHTVRVEVEERQFYGMWCLVSPQVNAGDVSCFWFDETGFLFARGFKSEGKFIKTVEDTSGRFLGIGRKALGAEALTNLFSVFEVLNETNVVAKTVRIEDPQAREIAVTTYEGAILYFSLDFSSSYTASTLRTLVGKPGLSKLEYIDFRVENRAYYK